MALLCSSLRAGREAVARGVTPLGKDAPFPARRALRSTASRPAEHVNINWKGYYDFSSRPFRAAGCCWIHLRRFNMTAQKRLRSVTP
ncbi:MAG: hypothetical protein OXE42_06720 [Gammaproteobacteria bacterium]|nr:hypothetical protein [Gammaproteobacteria bacterium]